MNKAKPFCISKQLFWDAYKRVRANKGAAGVDGQSITGFEKDLKNNLYKLWNRMSSGSYFPPAVKTVEIPKSDGRKRKLGIPTVSDRCAQMVVKLCLEPEIETLFHPDSYGYRPGKSAKDALATTRERCWRYDWVLDLDIKGFFDNIDHDLMMQVVNRHTESPWMRLYIERWLKAPAQLPDGTLEERDRGTPQGGVISPLLANLFLHYAFDEWMKRRCPGIPFERYADDIVVHLKTEGQAVWLRRQIEDRLVEWKLELHPDKTKIVYCQDSGRGGDYHTKKFDFLGFTFRPRRAKDRNGHLFVGFLPAASDKAIREMRRIMRSWHINRRSDLGLEEIAKWVNPVIRGWLTYYGQFYKSALHYVFFPLNCALTKWAMRKYKKLQKKKRRAAHWLGRVARRWPDLFAHWQIMPSMRPAVGR